MKGEEGYETIPMNLKLESGLGMLSQVSTPA